MPQNHTSQPVSSTEEEYGDDSDVPLAARRQIGTPSENETPDAVVALLQEEIQRLRTEAAGARRSAERRALEKGQVRREAADLHTQHRNVIDKIVKERRLIENELEAKKSECSGLNEALDSADATIARVQEENASLRKELEEEKEKKQGGRCLAREKAGLGGHSCWAAKEE